MYILLPSFLRLPSFIRVILVQAPEIIREEEYGTKVDMYSFALCLYEMVFAPNPLRALSRMTTLWHFQVFLASNDALLQAIIIAKRIALNQFRPSFPDSVVSEEFKQLIENCWKEDPDQRPTAEDALAILLRIRMVSSVDATKTPSFCNSCGRESSFLRRAGEEYPT